MSHLDNNDANKHKPAKDNISRLIADRQTPENLSVCFKKAASLSYRLAEHPTQKPAKDHGREL
jgi:hypothetical protein